jgi:allose kinase
MDDTNTVLGMDIGGTNLRSAFVDVNYNVEDFYIGKTAEILSGTDTTDKLALYITNLLKTRKIPPLAIVMGLPSTVDRTNRIIYSTPNIKGLDNVDIATYFKRFCDIPVFVIRDVCLLLLHDIYNNNLKKEGFILGFYIGTGFGNAISSNGKIVAGTHGVAGELGHIPVYGKADPCGCGNLGCLELYASGKRLAEIRDMHFKGMDFDYILENHSDHPIITEFIDYIATGISSEITILDPDDVILGGGVIIGKGFPREKLEAAIYKYTRKPYPANRLQFIYSKESDKNGVIGAGIFGFQKLGLYS